MSEPHSLLNFIALRFHRWWPDCAPPAEDCPKGNHKPISQKQMQSSRFASEDNQLSSDDGFAFMALYQPV
jgi:hypothetical protein